MQHWAAGGNTKFNCYVTNESFIIAPSAMRASRFGGVEQVSVR